MADGYVLDPLDHALVAESLRLFAADVRERPSGDPAAQLLLFGSAQRALELADEIESAGAA